MEIILTDVSEKTLLICRNHAQFFHLKLVEFMYHFFLSLH